MSSASGRLARLDRRRFLGATASSALGLLGCSDGEPARNPLSSGTDCPVEDPFSGGSMLGLVPFVGEDDAVFEVPLDSGLDGRLYTDLSRLDPDHLITSTEHFYIRTRDPDRIDRSAWGIDTGGLAGAPRRFSIEEIVGAEQEMGVHLLECSGNGRGAGFGLLSAAEWSGMPLSDLVESIEPAQGSRVLVSGFDDHSVPSAGGHSTPGASWVFSIEQIREAGAFLATRMNGEPLTPDHGAPVRLLVPGWYGCTCIKWVNRIELVDGDAPATSQMIEFASRTHQARAFEHARDYAPAIIQPAAMPVRVEHWRVGSRAGFRVVGILWGGTRTSAGLEIRFGDGPWEAVAVCPPRAETRTWSLWSHPWVPAGAGRYPIVLRFENRTVTSLRLDSGYYLREVEIGPV